MKKIILTTASATLLLLTTNAFAQMGAPGDRPERPEFTTVDTNQDEFLSSEELAVVATGNIDPERMMSRMDADKDGLISLAEYSSRPNRDSSRDKSESHSGGNH